MTSKQKKPPQGYGAVAIALHWLVALCIFGSLWLGFYMQALPFSPRKLELYSWHKWLGVSIFLLVLLRLSWRLLRGAPAMVEGLSAQVRRWAAWGHRALYLLMVVMPLTGWLMSSALGVQTVWFGVLPLPNLLPKDKAVGEMLRTLHGLLAYGLIALIAGHVLAALKHQFLDRVPVLQRMGLAPSNTQETKT